MRLIAFLALGFLPAAFAAGGTASSTYLVRGIDRLPGEPGIVRLGKVFSESERKALQELGLSETATTEKVSLLPGEKPEVVRRHLKRSGLRLELNAPIRFQSAKEDPLEKEQWALENHGMGVRVLIDQVHSEWVPGVAGEDIGLKRLGDATVQRKVVVAVIDTGIDPTHPEFAGQIARRESECISKDPKMDADGNGYAGDCLGWNAADGNADVRDQFGHGTHVSGIIAAKADGKGTRGIAPEAKILPIKVISEGIARVSRSSSSQLQESFPDIIAKALLYAIVNKVDVIQMSMAWPPEVHGQILRDLFGKIREKGILVVASAGNDGSPGREFPCGEQGVLCIGAHGPDGKIAGFSNFGESVDLLAPGVKILSTWPLVLPEDGLWIPALPGQFKGGAGYDFERGTSMAAPVASGAAAWLLMRGVKPTEVIPRLLRNARDPLQSIPRLDLARAWNEPLGPWITPSTKEPIRVVWAEERGFQASIELVNQGSESNAMELHAELLDEEGKPQDEVTLETRLIELPKLRTGETVSRTLSASASDLRYSGRFSLRLSSDDGKIRSRIPIEIERHWGREPLSGAKTRPITGDLVQDPDAWISVTGKDGSSLQDTLAVTLTGEGTMLQLLEEQEDRFVAHPPILLPITKTGIARQWYRSVFAVERVRLREGEDPVYAVWMEKVEKGEDPRTKVLGQVLRIFDRSGRSRPIAGKDSIFFEFGKIYVNPPVVWTRAKGKEASELMPSWIGVGATPDLDLPRYDPWNPYENDAGMLRVFHIDSAGEIRETPLAPGGMEAPVALFPQTDEEVSRGSARILIAGASTDRFTYRIAQLTSGKLEKLSEFHPNPYRSLLGITNNGIVRSAGDASGLPFRGASFIGKGSLGGVRATALSREGVQLELDFRARGSDEPTSSVFGIFSGGLPGANVSGFAMGDRDLIYREGPSGLEGRTSLRKFGFRSEGVTVGSYFPYAIGTEDGKLLPAIWIPEELGDVGDVSEWVVPKRTADGEIRLIRPASLRNRLQNGCVWMGDPRERFSTAPVEFWALCGSEIQSLPIRY